MVGDRAEQVRDHVDPRPALVVALHDVPGRLRDVGVHEHLILGPGVVLPPGDGLEVHGGQLPAAHRVLQPRLEPALLFLVADGEPVLSQQDAFLDQQPLEDGALVQEPAVLLLGAKTHDVLDASAIVPAPVEQDQLPRGGQVADVPLEVPLGALALGGSGQGHDAGQPGVEVLGDALDRAALARRVPALEDDHDAGTLGAQPLLHLDQLGLQPVQLLLVDSAREPCRLLLDRSVAVRLGHRHSSCPAGRRVRPR